MATRPYRAPRPGRPRPLWQLIVAHIVALGICLVLYALPHHVIHKHQDVSTGITSSRDGVVAAMSGTQPTETPDAGPTPNALTGEVAATPEPTAAPTPEPTPAEPVGSFRTKFADRFTSGEVVRTDTTYQSANLNITLSSGFSDVFNNNWYVADFYIADISCLGTAYRGDKYGHGYSEWASTVAKNTQSIITLNGDYYVMRDGGIVIRDGTLYRNEKNINDVCVLYWDGTVRTFNPSMFDAEGEMANGAYQSWCFGPSLLDEDGTPSQSFNSSVGRPNPRSVFGYYEPGHYCFVSIDGRDSTSEGITLHQLADFMHDLGCKQAYNLDGGATSALYAGTTQLNHPAGGGRKCCDFIIVVDRVTES